MSPVGLAKLGRLGKGCARTSASRPACGSPVRDRSICRRRCRGRTSAVPMLPRASTFTIEVGNRWAAAGSRSGGRHKRAFRHSASVAATNSPPSTVITRARGSMLWASSASSQVARSAALGIDGPPHVVGAWIGRARSWQSFADDPPALCEPGEQEVIGIFLCRRTEIVRATDVVALPMSQLIRSGNRAAGRSVGAHALLRSG